ncbi:hypothetical protein F4777DRAFT_387181 [Nemania sp. FL0916]|nr:hypothetical protein F4777DRAFT_387181 [Nemania sp. FL0916]
MAIASPLHKTLGFARPVHLWTWFVLGGGLAAFSAHSLRYLYFDSVFCGTTGGDSDTIGALPGECFYFLRTSLARFSIKAHLWCILPAGILAAFQFVPALRRSPALLRVHRTIGYSSLVLGLTGALVSLPIIRHTFGGSLAAQTSTGLLLVLFVIAQVAGYVSVKQRNIPRHRRWMLRSWIWASAIISMRVVMVVTALVISLIGGYYTAMPCEKISFTLESENKTLQWYPECSPYFTKGDISRRAIVDANVFGPNVMQMAAAFNLSYGMSAWLAVFCHVVGSEIYIRSVAPPMGLKKDAAKSR